MLINFDTPILGIDDKPMLNGAANVTLKDVALISLMSELPTDKPNADEKGKRFDLAMQIRDGGTVELKVEDVARIKERVAHTHGALVYGRVRDAIETPAEPNGTGRKLEVEDPARPAGKAPKGKGAQAN